MLHICVQINMCIYMEMCIYVLVYFALSLSLCLSLFIYIYHTWYIHTPWTYYVYAYVAYTCEQYMLELLCMCMRMPRYNLLESMCIRHACACHSMHSYECATNQYGRLDACVARRIAKRHNTYKIDDS